MALRSNSKSIMDAATRYLASVHRVLDEISLDQIRGAAELIAGALRSNGIIHVFGSGHSAMLAQEVFFRAGGLVAVSPILDSRLGFTSGVLASTEFERRAESAELLTRKASFLSDDVGIVISNSGRNTLPIEVAVRMKSAGMKVIALTNLEQSQRAKSRHPSGMRLFEVADAVLDNHCPPGDAAVVIEGISTALGPVSTIAGAALLHSTFLKTAELLAREGKPPDVFASANLESVTIDDLKRLMARLPGTDPVLPSGRG